MTINMDTGIRHLWSTAATLILQKENTEKEEN